jgi:tungstate transport system substrate-binding protein
MIMLRRAILGLAAAILLPLQTAGTIAQDRAIALASTTSTEQSGLFAHLLPAFTAKSGIKVNVVAGGTGQALDIGRRGDADVVFVHDRAAGDKFMAGARREAPGDPPQLFSALYGIFVANFVASDGAEARRLRKSIVLPAKSHCGRWGGT